MRFFYDVYAPRRRGELALFLLDLATIAATALYASGAALRPSWALDAPLVALWAASPRALARIAELIHRRYEFGKALRGTVLLVGLIVTLLLAGWELIVVSAPEAIPVQPETFGVLALAWASGFFLFDPRTYRLSDVFLLSTIVMAAKDAMPGGLYWIPAILAVYLQACALRHLLHDVLPARTARARRRRLNFQNGRAVAAIFASAGAVVFVLSWFAVRASLAPIASRGGDRQPGSAALTVTGEGTDAAQDSGETDTPDDGREDEESGASRKVGLRYRVNLRDLTMARYDPREALHVAVEAGSWRPARSTLWKATSFSTFDAAASEWSEESVLTTTPWPARGGIELAVLRRASDTPRQSRASVKILSPSVRNFILPYYPISLSANGYPEYRVNEAADIYPLPAFGDEAVYRFVCLPEDGAGQPPRATAGAPPGERNLDVPDARRLGVDLSVWLQTLLRARVGALAEAPLDEKVATLAEAFGREFRYSDRAHWRAGETPLARFLLEERIGDCTYHATAVALLLRTLGVPTRLCVGYLGVRWDPERLVYVVANGQAHSWIEVHAPEAGWTPIDPTRWVPVDKSYVPPPELIAAALPASAVTVEGIALEEIDLEESAADLEAPDLESPLAADVPGRFRGGSSALETEQRGAHSQRAAGPHQGGSAFTEYGYGPIYYENMAPLDPLGTSLPPGEIEIGAKVAGSGGREDAERDESEENAGRAAAHAAWGSTRPFLRLVIALAAAALLVGVLRAYFRSSEAEEDEEEEPEEPDDALEAETRGASDDGLSPLIDASEPSGQVIAAYHRLQQSLTLTRNHRREHQTPLEHGHEHSRRHRRLESPFRRLHRAFYRALYGQGAVRADTVGEVEEDCRRIRKTLG